jgi:hypothetical protein
MSACAYTMEQELDSRRSGSLLVTLLWDPESARVTVAVEDTSASEGFRLDVFPAEDAVDVFHHPYAHAAQRGIEPMPLGAGAG